MLSKTVAGGSVGRGFKSLPLRLSSCAGKPPVPPRGLTWTARSVRRASMRAVLSAIAAALVVTAFAYGATPVSGNLTLASFDPKQACKFMSTTMPALPTSYGPAVRAIAAGSKVLLAKCSPGSPATKFTGTPATRSAGYGWNWWLAVGKNGRTTGLAVELGNAVLVPATGTQLTLQLIGVQHPVGPQTSSHAGRIRAAQGPDLRRGELPQPEVRQRIPAADQPELSRASTDHRVVQGGRSERHRRDAAGLDAGRVIHPGGRLQQGRGPVAEQSRRHLSGETHARRARPLP